MSMEDLAIREAKLYDVPFIARIERELFDTPRSAEAITNDITKDDDSIYIVVAEQGTEHGMEKIGYADMRIIAGEAEIYNIAISRDYRARGYGESLLEHLIYKSNERGCDSITLEVSSTNTAGIGLYSKMGFKEVGRRKGYYSSDNTDAILMTKYLAQIQIDIQV